MATERKLIGPFSQLISLAGLPMKGALKDEALHIMKDGGILIAEGRILEVGKFGDLKSKASHIEELADDVVGLPGLIDCHTHLVWAGSRARDYSLRNAGSTYQDILAAGGGIFDTVGKTQQASKADLIEQATWRAKRHLTEGVTTIEVKTGYGLLPEHEIRILEVIQEVNKRTPADLISTCLAAHVCPRELSPESFLELIERELFPILKSRNLTHRVDIFVEEKAFPVVIAKKYLEVAKQAGFQLTLHADQFTTGGSALAVEMGALSADHLEASTQHEIDLLARSNTVAVALPGASLGLGMAFTPARKLLDGGAALAIASDWNPGSAPMGDLLAQAAILGAFEKLSAAEVFSGLTFRAAIALGLNDRGTLEACKQADFIAFPSSDYRDILYQQGRMKPMAVWKNGIKI